MQDIDRKVTRITSHQMNVLVRDFTLGSRLWTSFSADKIETILRYYHLIKNNEHYVKFDTKTEELIFTSNIMMDETYSFWQRLKFKIRFLLN